MSEDKGDLRFAAALRYRLRSARAGAIMQSLPVYPAYSAVTGVTQM